VKSAPALRHVPVSPGPLAAHGLPARWAVSLTAVFAGAVLAAIVTFAVGYAVGGQNPIEDDWVAHLGGILALIGLLASLAAFVLAIVAKIERERWS
jgi:membrane protein DedA with SNARE-associated domain